MSEREGGAGCAIWLFVIVLVMTVWSLSDRVMQLERSVEVLQKAVSGDSVSTQPEAPNK